jgi:competence protein ComEC
MPEGDLQPTLSVAWQQAFGRRPLVLLTVALIAGIAWADAVTPPAGLLVGLCGLSLGLAALVWRAGGGLAVVPLLLGVALAGGAHMTVRLHPPASDLSALAGQRVAGLVGVVQQAYPAQPWGQRVVLRGEALAPPGYWGRVLVTLPRETCVTSGQLLRLDEVALRSPPRAGTPGERDQARTLARERIHVLGRAGAVTVLSPAAAPGRWRQTIVESVRQRLLTSLRTAMPGSQPQLYADLLTGMVFGIQAAPLPPEIITLFRRSATIHLLVVSGAQLSIIALALVFLVRGGRRSFPAWGVLPILATLVAFSLLAGPGPSINRALAMAALLLLSLTSGRRYDFPTALAASALVLCLLDPSIVFDAGAQLTYACCLGVYLALPRGEPSHHPVRRTLLAAGWGTLGAWAYSSPLLIVWFNSLPLLGGLANLIAVPLATLILYLGFAASALGLVAAPLALPSCLAARGLLEVLLLSNRLFAALPGSTLDLVTLSPAGVVGWYALATAALLALRSPELRQTLWAAPWRRLAPVVGLGLLVVAVFVAVWHFGQPRLLEVHILDVGAGQCVVIRTPTGRTVMLDAGCDSPAGQAGAMLQRRVMPYLARQRLRRLDWLLLSHAHEDHCNFAGEVVRRMAVGQVLTGPDLGAGAGWTDLHQAAAQRRVPCTPVPAGAALQLDDQCRLQVLQPRRLMRGTRDDANNNSLVLRLEYGRISFLFPSDLQHEGEARLLADYADRPELLRATVLLASHHGSRHSGSPRFVQAVRPQVVVVSGQPDRRGGEEGLQVFSRRGITVWRTDTSGTLLLKTDGTRLTVSETRP